MGATFSGQNSGTMSVAPNETGTALLQWLFSFSLSRLCSTTILMGRSIKAVGLDVGGLIQTAFGNWMGCGTPFTKRSGVFSYAACSTA